MISMIWQIISTALTLAIVLSIPFVIVLVVLFFKNMDRRLKNIETALEQLNKTE